MYKRMLCCFLATLYLTGSVIFPLGDFSLMRDIPRMYQNYSKVTCAEELGVVDFIGDYLLYGKQIFGHNQRDKVPGKGNEVQFQHQASATNVVFNQLYQILFIIPFILVSHASFNLVIYSSDYRSKLFRPPLA